MSLSVKPFIQLHGKWVKGKMKVNNIGNKVHHCVVFTKRSSPTLTKSIGSFDSLNNSLYQDSHTG